VLDASAFTADLPTVKRVAGYRRFVSIVPSTAVHQLDMLKKSNRFVVISRYRKKVSAIVMIMYQ
jgi:hypothetical protein